MRRYLGLLLLCAAGCAHVSASQLATSYRNLAATSLAVQTVNTDETKPTPNPGDKCTNCNGTGKVGDGVVMTTCLVCDGTGVLPGDPISSNACKNPECFCEHCKCINCSCRLEAKTDAQTVTQGVALQKPGQNYNATRLVLITAKSCAPCAKWKADVMPIYLAAGWREGFTIEIREYGDGEYDRPVPEFRWIEHGKTIRTHTGYMSFEETNRFIKGDVSPAAPSALQSSLGASPLTYVGGSCSGGSCSGGYQYSPTHYYGVSYIGYSYPSYGGYYSGGCANGACGR